MNLTKKSPRLLMLLCALLMSVSAFAFNFAGKTFKGSMTENGKKATLTVRFSNNNRYSSTLTGTGIKTQTQSGYWEVSGGFINTFNQYGDPAYLTIDWEDEDGNALDTPQLFVG